MIVVGFATNTIPAAVIIKADRKFRCLRIFILHVITNGTCGMPAAPLALAFR